MLTHADLRHRQSASTTGRLSQRLGVVRRLVKITVGVVLLVLIFGSAEASADTWSSETSGTTQQLNSGRCTSSSNCMAVGNNGTLIATTNGGSSWASLTSGLTSGLESISCPSSSNCVAVGVSGHIIATTSGGSSWSSQTSGVSVAMYGVSCTSTSDCWAVGASGTILVTTNGGSSWSAQTSGVTSTLQSVWCASSSDCWAVGASGKILATTNGGSSWASQTSGVTGTLYGVACNSTSACLAVGASGKILTTANSGSTWSSQTSGTTNQLNAISCASSSLCWAVGASGTILATTNGGSSWASQTSGTTNQLMGVFCLTGACWADGVSGTIVAAKAPANTAAPSITGTVSQGQVLTASAGTWTGSATISYAYQWQDCTTAAETSCSNISSATSSTYTLQSSDVGSFVAVKVTGSNSEGSASAMSASGLVASSSSYRGAVQAAGPVAFWPLDDSSLSTAFDVSGNGNNGTYASGVTTGMLDQTGPTGSGGGSVSLDGSSGAYVLFPGSLLPSSSTADTVEMWFKTSSTNGILMGSEYSLGPSQPTAWDPMLYVDSSGYLQAELWYDGALNTIISTAPVDDGHWHEAVVTVTTGGTEKLLVDGNAEATGTLSSSPSPGYATIGAGSSQGDPSGNNGWETFNGQIADVSIYRTALSQATVDAQYEDAVGNTPTNTATPAITGTPGIGDVLTASSGGWSGSTPITYTYQWQDCTTAAETSCSNISGATASTYTVQSSDAGSFVAVNVTGTNTNGSASALSASALVTSSSSYVSAVQAASPVAFWPLDDPSLSTAFDVSGNGKDAAYASGVTTGMLDQTGFTGSGGGSLGLTGSSSAYVTFPGNLLPGSSTADTVEMWFKTSSTNGILMGSEYSLGPSQPSAWDPMLYIDSSGDLQAELWWDGSYNTIASSSTVDDGNWHEAVVTVTTGGTETLYVDGTSQGTATLTSSPTPGYATIGAGSSQSFPNGASGWATFNGQIADVSLYQTALSSTTIDAQYADAAVTAPSNTAAPAITGTPEDGDVLTASTGTWSGSAPITYTYQWKDCTSTAETSCSNISGATSSTYTAQSSDVGSYLAVTVTATNAAGSASTTSAATAIVDAQPPTNTALPAITGTATDGQTLTASPGSWLGSTPISYSYQWEDCNSSGSSCVNITGATGSTYTLRSSDVGHKIVVSVTASNASLPGGSTATASSSATAVVAAVAPTNKIIPVIIGTVALGQTLTASTGTWTGSTPLTYSYQWEDCNSSGASCTNISGATSSAYAIAGSDVGSTLAVVVTATNAAGSASAAAAATAVVQSATAPSDTALPALSGTASIGQTLTASSGTWTGSAPINYSYQWEDCDQFGDPCTTIAGATGLTYEVGTGDVGQELEVVVTASNGAGTASATSSETAVVPAVTCSPSISSVSAFSAAKTQTVTIIGTCFGVEGEGGSGATGVLFDDTSQGWSACGAHPETCYFTSWTNDSITFAGFGGIYDYFGPGFNNGDLVDVEIPNAQTAAGPGECQVVIGATGGSSCTLPVNAVAPAIAGTAALGQTLTASTGSWSGSTPINYSYQWEDCDQYGDACTDIPGATGSTYTVATADIGQSVEVAVTADNSSLAGGGTVSATSSETTVVPAVACSPSITSVSAFSTAKTQTVTITGSCFGVEGEGGSGPSGVSFDDTSQGWSACDTSPETCYFTLWTNDTITFAGFGGLYDYFGPGLNTGDSVDVEIPNAQTGAGPGSCLVTVGAATSCTSPPAVAPAITGSPVQGQTLTASSGTWSGPPPSSYSYQWQDCNSSGSSCVNITGATGATYILQGSDVGSTVEVTVTATSTGGSASASSAPTVVITPVMIQVPECDNNRAEQIARCSAALKAAGFVVAERPIKDATCTSDSSCYGSSDNDTGTDDRIGTVEGMSSTDSGTYTETGMGQNLPYGATVYVFVMGYQAVPLRVTRGCDPAVPGLCGSDSSVNPATGDFNQSSTDVTVQSYGPPLTFTRTYDSSLAQEQTTASTPGVLGYGWTDNWNTYLTFQTSPAAVTVNEASGAEVQFVAPVSGSCPTGTTGPGTTGTYCENPYITARLTYDSSSNTYTFITHPYESYTFNASGQLTGEAGPGGAALTLAYGTPAPGAGNCPSTASSCNTVTSASGRALVIGSNSAGLVTSVTDPRGNTWTYSYCSLPSTTCSAGDLVSVTDPLTHVTSYTYDQGNTHPALVNDLLTITNPNGQPGGQNAGAHQINAYNPAGQVTSQTDPDGYATTTDYSGMDISTGTGDTIVTDPDGNQTDYGYTAGTLTSKTEAYGTADPSTWTYNPDPNTYLNLSVTDPNNNTTSYTYDADGNTTSVTDPLGRKSTSSFNSFDEQTCATKPLAASGCPSLTPPAAVSAGGTISPPTSAPPAYATYGEYDTAGNPIWTTTGDYAPGSGTPTQSRTTYQLYSGESVTIGGSSDSCAAAPPSTSLPCLTINPDGVVTQLGYNGTTGDLTSSSTPDGNAGGETATTTYSYNADGEQATVVAPDGNLSGATAADYTTTNTYTADDQLYTQTVGSGTAARETIYGYDADGNQNAITDARTYTTTKLYDANDQLTLVTDPDSQQTLTCYDGDGNVTETVPASGVAANSLTPASCPTSYPTGYGDRLASDATTNTYDALGNKTTVTTPAPAGQSGSETTTNVYDLAGQLKTVTAPPVSNDAGAPNQVTSYTYDAAGELLTTDQHGSPDATTSYCYDPDGNKTATVAPDGNPTGLTSCSTSAPYQTTSPYQTGYTYDSLGEHALDDHPIDERNHQPDHKLQLRPGRQHAHKRGPSRRHHDQHVHAAEPA